MFIACEREALRGNAPFTTPRASLIARSSRGASQTANTATDILLLRSKETARYWE